MSLSPRRSECSPPDAPDGAEIDGVDVPAWLEEVEGVVQSGEPHPRIVAQLAAGVRDDDVPVEKYGGAQGHPQEGMDGGVVALYVFRLCVDARQITQHVSAVNHDQRKCELREDKAESCFARKPLAGRGERRAPIGHQRSGSRRSRLGANCTSNVLSVMLMKP